VESRCGGHGIEVIGPRPRGVRVTSAQRDTLRCSMDYTIFRPSPLWHLPAGPTSTPGPGAAGRTWLRLEEDAGPPCGARGPGPQARTDHGEPDRGTRGTGPNDEHGGHPRRGGRARGVGPRVSPVSPPWSPTAPGGRRRFAATAPR
jgi:hypothetical protein